MGGHSVEVGVRLGRSATSDALGKVHELLVRTVERWLDVNLRSGYARIRGDYYPSARSYAAERGLWGPAADGSPRLTYFFSDFTGLEHLGAEAMSHWFELVLTLVREPIEPFLHELDATIDLALPSPDRYVCRHLEMPLVELSAGDDDTELYWLQWPESGRPSVDEPVLFSSEGVPRRSLASLSEKERRDVEIAATIRQCGCSACDMLRSWYWQGFDGWGRLFDFGWNEGVARFEAGDFRGARAELLEGLLSGAPLAQEGYGVWIASTLSREGDGARALWWLRYAVAHGWKHLDDLRADADLAHARGAELDALIARGPRSLPTADRGKAANVPAAWALFGDEMLARRGVALHHALGKTGDYPSPPPPDFGKLLDDLEARGARPTPEALVGLVYRLAHGARPDVVAQQPRAVPSPEVQAAAAEQARTMVYARLTALLEAPEVTRRWTQRTTPPVPDRWPLTPDARLLTYGFAYAPSGVSPTLMIAGAPFAFVAYGLDHDAPVCVPLGDTIEELGNHGVVPLDPPAIERLKALPTFEAIYASALVGPLDEPALDALTQRFAFFARYHGLVMQVVRARHPDFAAWLAARGIT